MKINKIISVGLFLSLLTPLIVSAQGPIAKITNISPAAGPVDYWVTIKGENLHQDCRETGGQLCTMAVCFGKEDNSACVYDTNPASLKWMGNNLVKAQVPSGAVSGPVYLLYQHNYPSGGPQAGQDYYSVSYRITGPTFTVRPEITLPVIYPVSRTLTLSLNTPVIDNDIEMEFNLVGVGDNYADIEMNYSKRNSYEGFRWDPRKTGWLPNPGSYPEYYEGSSLLSAAQRVYRSHYLCDGTTVKITNEQVNQNTLTLYPDFAEKWLGKHYQEILELAGGYGNFFCGNRFNAQCILDDSYDRYYDERCDCGKVRFKLGETKLTTDFSVKLSKLLTTNQVEIEITDKKNTTLIKPSKIELMRVKGEAGVYAVDKIRDVKMPVIDKSILESYGIKPKGVKEVENKVLETYETAKPVGFSEKSLVKSPSKSTVYMVDEGELKPIASPAVLKRMGYTWKNVKVVPESVIKIHYIGEIVK